MSTLNELEYYCKEENVYGAVMLTGGWGSGKTYLIDNHLAKRLENDFIFIRISLFGLSSINDINQKVKKAYFQKILFTVGENQTNKKIKRFWESFKKNKFEKIIKVATAVAKNIPSVNQVLAFDPSEYITVENDIAGKQLVLVFDDLERCTLDEIEVLGCINEYCENKKIKTIIIANEEKIIEKKGDIGEEKKQGFYSEIKEKIIIRTIKNNPIYKDIFKNIIQEYKSKNENYKQFLNQNLVLLNNIFISGDIKNVRSIKCAIQDFERIYVILEDKCDLDLIKNYYQTFLVYILLLKAGKIGNNSEYGNLFDDKELREVYPTYYNRKYMIQGIKEWLIHGEWNGKNIRIAIEESIKSNEEKSPEEIVKNEILFNIDDQIIKEGFPIVLKNAYNGKLTVDQYINLIENAQRARKLNYTLPENIDYNKLKKGVDRYLKSICDNETENIRISYTIENQNNLLNCEKDIYLKILDFKKNNIQKYAINRRNYLKALNEKNINKILECKNNRCNVFDKEMAVAVSESFEYLSNADCIIFNQVFAKMWNFEDTTDNLNKENSKEGFEILRTKVEVIVYNTKTKGLLMKSAIANKFLDTINIILKNID